MRGDAIVSELNGRIYDYINSKRKIQAHHTNRASELGHPCLRYLYYCRTDWDRMTIPSMDLMEIYAEGNEQEMTVIRLLTNMGYKVEGSEQDYFLPGYKISGHVDGFINVNGERIGIEIKSISPYLFKSIETVDDLKNSKHYWHKSYIVQATLYMAMTYSSQWLYIFKNKNAMQIRLIYFEFDLDLYNSIIDKVILINNAVDKKEPPDFTDQHQLCDKCSFFHICNPEYGISNTGLEIVTDPNIELKLKDYWELKEKSERFEQLKEELKMEFTGRNVIGNGFKILSKLVEVKCDPNPKPRKDYKYWNMKILKV